MAVAFGFVMVPKLGRRYVGGPVRPGNGIAAGRMVRAWEVHELRSAGGGTILLKAELNPE